MAKRMLIDAVRPEETRVVIVGDHNRIEEFDFITSAKSQVKGNIYLAKITRVEPSLQAAFVEYGGDKQGFLSFSEIHPDYYQIPIADRKRLLEEQARLEREEAERDARREREEDSRRARRDQQEGGVDGDVVEEYAASEEGEDEGREGRGNRSRRRGRRRTYAARMKDEQAAEIATRSDVVEGVDDLPSPAEPLPDVPVEKVSAEALPAPEHVASGEAEEAAPAVETEAPAEEAVTENEPAEKPNTLDTASDEEDIERYRKSVFSKRYRIQEVVKRGQIVLVQVIKEERGNKGVSLTTYISLAGRYCVLMPNASKDGGISRKVGKNEERKRLRDIAAEMKESCGMSVIIRTAGVGRTKIEIKRDHDYLVKLWNLIREDALAANAPALIYEESDILKRSIRDYYEPEIEEILVQGDNAYKGAKEFMKLIMPSHAPRVKQYRETTPILSDYHVESQLEEMYQPVAKLRSGGYVVINHTEALISIDVNSGRSTSERNVEETALKTNLEAAREIARQLRLRDLGGLIVVDFIDMFYGKNRRAVERAFKDALRADRAKIQVGHISPFGLLELSRQRLRPSISETTTLPCPHCKGTGFIRSNESVAIEIVRALEREASSGTFRELRVTVSTETALHMLNCTRRYLNEVEEKFNVSVVIKSDHSYLSSQYSMEKIRRPADQIRYEKDRQRSKPEDVEMEEGEEATVAPEFTEGGGGEEGQPRRRRSRGGRGRNRRRNANREGGAVMEAPAEGDAPSMEAETPVAEEAAPVVEAAEEQAEEKPKTRRKTSSTRRPKAADKASDETVAEEAAEEKPAPRTRRKPAASKTAKATKADKDSKAEEKPAAPKPSARKAAASGKASTPVAEEPPAGPARKGWWSKVMS